MSTPPSSSEPNSVAAAAAAESSQPPSFRSHLTEFLSVVKRMAVDNPSSLFLQDVCPQFRRTLLAEHDRHVRKAKREHLLLHSAQRESGSEENIDENDENEVESPSKRLCTSCEDDSLPTVREIPTPAPTPTTAPTQAVVPLNEPRVLRAKVVEKYLSLGRALFNDHDAMGTLYLLHYPNHYENVKQINRVWTPVFNPAQRKNVPLLLSSSELQGITRSVEFLQKIFDSYPDCVTTHESKVSAATPYGEKVVVKQRFFGTKVPLPPVRANRVAGDVEGKSVSSSFPSFSSLFSSTSFSSSAPINIDNTQTLINRNVQVETNSISNCAHSHVNKTPSSVNNDSNTSTAQSAANGGESTPFCSPPLSTPNVLDICFYTTIFFDQHNKVYEIWHDSVIPTPPELASSFDKYSV